MCAIFSNLSAQVLRAHRFSQTKIKPSAGTVFQSLEFKPVVAVLIPREVSLFKVLT